MDVINVIKKFESLFLTIVYFLIVSLLIYLNIFREPEVFQSIFTAVIILLIILIILLVIYWRNKPYERKFINESQALKTIKKFLEKSPNYECIRICGTSCTSVFQLFDLYVEVLVNKKLLQVCILNPNQKKIISYLKECESDKSDVVEMIGKKLSSLREKISDPAYNHIKKLISKKDPYGKNLIEASILLWQEVGKKAQKKEKILTGGLELYLYSHLPTLKAWIFGEKVMFIGSYGPFPGGVGINNPILLLQNRKKKQKEIIDDSLRTISFLTSHKNTKKIEQTSLCRNLKIFRF